MDRAADGRRAQGRRHLAFPPGAAVRDPDESRSPRRARAVAAELPAGGAVRRRRPTGRDDPRARAVTGEAHGLQPACQRRRAAARPRAPRLPALRSRGSPPGGDDGRGDPRARPLPRRGAAPERGRPQLPDRRPRRDGIQPAGGRLRGHEPCLDGRAHAGRRGSGGRRQGHGDPLRARLPGLARGLPAHRPTRPLLVLRGVRAHRRLHVQPARQVAEDCPQHPVAATGRVAQLPAHLTRLAPGPQRLLAPGPRASSTTS